MIKEKGIQIYDFNLGVFSLADAKTNLSDVAKQFCVIKSTLTQYFTLPLNERFRAFLPTNGHFYSIIIK